MRVAKGVIIAIIAIIVIGMTVPTLWGTFTDTSTNMTDIGTDAGSTFIETAWPVVLLLVAIAIGAGVLIYALRRFKVLGRGR